MKDESDIVLDLSDLDTKRRLMSKIGGLTGLHEVRIKPRKKTRSLNANRYYWSAVVTPWLDWLRREYGDPSLDKDQAHELLKETVLGRTALVSKDTGRRIDVPPRTRGMKTDEFAQYVEACAKFLAEFAGIVVLPAEVFYQR